MCYSWWCLSALAILGRLHWIDGAALSRFILFCQARPPRCSLLCVLVDATRCVCYKYTAALPACAC